MASAGKAGELLQAGAVTLPVFIPAKLHPGLTVVDLTDYEAWLLHYPIVEYHRLDRPVDEVGQTTIESPEQTLERLHDASIGPCNLLNLGHFVGAGRPTFDLKLRNFTFIGAVREYVTSSKQEVERVRDFSNTAEFAILGKDKAVSVAHRDAASVYTRVKGEKGCQKLWLMWAITDKEVED